MRHFTVVTDPLSDHQGCKAPRFLGDSRWGKPVPRGAVQVVTVLQTSAVAPNSVPCCDRKHHAQNASFINTDGCGLKILVIKSDGQCLCDWELEWRTVKKTTTPVRLARLSVHSFLLSYGWDASLASV